MKDEKKEMITGFMGKFREKHANGKFLMEDAVNDICRYCIECWDAAHSNGYAEGKLNGYHKGYSEGEYHTKDKLFSNIKDLFNK